MIDFSLPVILTTFGIIFLAELPDKTAFASLALATKFKARDVVFGSWLAFLIQTVVAVVAGRLLSLLPAAPVHVVSGIGFLVFAYLAFKENLKEELTEEEEAVKKESALHHRPVWISSFLVVFAAEWGDLSQLATAALIATSKTPWSVALGAVGALWSVTLLAVLTGAKLSRSLPKDKLNILSGLLFATIGLILIVTTLL